MRVYQPHILLIEDDAAVCAATCLLLKTAGYRVSAAACTAEAVAHARAHRDIEFVISDYRLAHLENGVQAIAAVRAVSGPGLKAVLISGDTGLLLTDVERGPDTAIANKPIDADELIALLPALQPTAECRSVEQSAGEQKVEPKVKIALADVRLDPFGIRVVAAPLRYCACVRWNDHSAVIREPGGDWSEVAAVLNSSREAHYRRHVDGRGSPARAGSLRTLAAFHRGPWRENEVAVACWSDGRVLDDPATCATCGNEFVRFAAPKGAVCSDKCRPKRMSRAKPVQPKACVVCGTTFIPRRFTTRLCSTECRKVMLRAGTVSAPRLRRRGPPPQAK